MSELPTNKEAEIMSKKLGAKGCVITLYFDDHNHVAVWFSTPVGRLKRSDAIDMLDGVLSGVKDLEKKIDET